MTTQTMPIVTVVDGAVTTLSTDVASFFEKDHAKVIRAIENILEKTPFDRKANFGETVVTRVNPSGGAPIKSKAYRLTRDGFTFLAMGFTGERAQAFKWAYIDAFNQMEAKLHAQVPALSNGKLNQYQLFTLRKTVDERAKRSGRRYQSIYKYLKAKYQVKRIEDIPDSCFEECIDFVRTMELQPDTLLPNGDAAWVSVKYLKHQLYFIFMWRYLFRNELDAFCNFLSMVKSPMAPHFWEAVHNLHLAEDEELIARLGFPLKDEPFFKAWQAQQH